MTDRIEAIRAGKFRKRPVVIDAFQLGEAWPDWWADAVSACQITTHNNDDRWRGGPDYAIIKTLEGDLRADKGDWIIRGVKGEIYACKPDIFALQAALAVGDVERPAVAEERKGL